MSEMDKGSPPQCYWAGEVGSGRVVLLTLLGRHALVKKKLRELDPHLPHSNYYPVDGAQVSFLTHKQECASIISILEVSECMYIK